MGEVGLSGAIPLIGFAAMLGMLWRPGLVLSILGFFVFLIGALLFLMMTRQAASLFTVVAGSSALYMMAAGIGTLAFGRLIALVEGIRRDARQTTRDRQGEAFSSKIAVLHDDRREPSFGV